MEHQKLNIAKKRYRVLAFIIDLFVFWTVGFVIGYFFGEPVNGDIGFNLEGTPALALMLFGLISWPMSEGFWGQTLGKSALNLKVVDIEGNRIGIGKSFIRFLLGYVDSIFLIGLLVASNNKHNQRIGDLVAKTLVVQK